MVVPLRTLATGAALSLALVLTGCSSGGGIMGWRGASAAPNTSAYLKNNNMSPPASESSGFSASLQSAWDKTTGYFTPKPVEAVDTLSLSRPAKAPGPEFYVSVARLQEGSGNFSGAVEQYEKALEQSPHDLAATLGLARLYDRQGKLNEATRYYRRALEHHPDHAPAYNDLGMCYQKQGSTSDAASLLRRAVELQPDKTLYRNNLALALVELGQVDEAVTQLSPAHGAANAHYNVAFVLNKLGRKEEALGQFRLALRENPQLTAAQTWVAALSTELGEPLSASNVQAEPVSASASDGAASAAFISDDSQPQFPQ